MQAIFKREFRSYFHTVVGPVFMAALLFFTGIFFTAYNLFQGYPHFSAVLSSITVVLLLLVPLLTMRSFAEEKRMKTDQLLLTSPVSVTEVVMGKFLSMTAVFGIACLLMFLAPVLIHFYGGGAFLADSVAIVEFFLMGAAYIAIGMFISSLTENQLIAAVGTFAVLLLLQLADSMSSILPSSALESCVCFLVLIIAAALLLFWLTRNLIISCGTGLVAAVVLMIFYVVKKSAFEGSFGRAFASLSLVSRFDAITRQSFELSAVIYFITVSALFIFLTVQAIQKRRWS